MWRAQATCHFLKCFHLPLEKYSYDITLKLTNQCCDQSTHSSKVSGSVFLQHSSKVKWCVVDIFCSMRQSLLHFGVEQETDVTLPPVRDPPPTLPLTHTHTFKQFSACRGRVLFQRLVTWSVFNWGSFNRTREAFSLPTLTLSTYHRLILIIGVTLGSHRLLMTQILCNNHDALNDQGGLQLGSPLLREKDVFVSAQVSWLTGGSCLCSTTDVKRNYRDDALGIIMWKKRGNEHCFILTVTVNIFYRFRCVWHINLSRCWQDFWLMLHFINDFVCRLCEIVVLSLLYDFWQFCLSIWKEWSWHN